MSSVVLDASAVLAVLHGEPGADVVASALVGTAIISSVNLAEIVGKLADAGVPRRSMAEILDPLGIEVAPFDADLAYRAGMLRPLTRGKGLSLGDRACLALALERALPVLTADAIWHDLAVGVDVRPIR